MTVKYAQKPGYRGRSGFIRILWSDLLAIWVCHFCPEKTKQRQFAIYLFARRCFVVSVPVWWTHGKAVYRHNTSLHDGRLPVLYRINLIQTCRCRCAGTLSDKRHSVCGMGVFEWGGCAMRCGAKSCDADEGCTKRCGTEGDSLRIYREGQEVGYRFRNWFRQLRYLPIFRVTWISRLALLTKLGLLIVL
jgi:hypothetical protein